MRSRLSKWCVAALCAALVASLPVRAADDDDDDVKPERQKVILQKVREAREQAEALRKAALEKVAAQRKAAVAQAEQARHAESQARRQAEHHVAWLEKVDDDAAKAMAEAKHAKELAEQRLAEAVKRFEAAAARAKAKKDRKEAYIGVITEPVPEIIAVQFEHLLSSGQGLAVRRVMADSPAARSGLEKNDIMILYDGKKLHGAEQLKELVLAGQPGKKVKVVVIRNSKTKDVQVELGERSASKVEDVIVDNKNFQFFPKNAFEGLDGKIEMRLHDALKKHGAGHPPIIMKRFNMGSDSNISQQSISVSVNDGQYNIEVSYTDKDGKKHHAKFSGTAKEILPKLKSLPPSIRQSLEQSLKQSGGDGAGEKDNVLFFGDGGEGKDLLLKIIGEAGKPGAALGEDIQVKVIGKVMADVEDQLKDLPEKIRIEIKKSLKDLPKIKATEKRERSQ